MEGDRTLSYGCMSLRPPSPYSMFCTFVMKDNVYAKHCVLNYDYSSNVSE